MHTQRQTVRLPHQLTAFVGVGVVAAVLHYGVLIGLVEAGGFGPVTATLLGYVAGGIASYLLNRRFTYASDRPHAEATWRFALVAFVGFLITWVLMSGFEWLAGPSFALWYVYLAAQAATTGLVLVWSFLAHKVWTFGAPPSPPGQGG